MNLEKIKEFIIANKDNSEVKEFIESLAPTPEISLDLIKSKVNEDPEVKQFIDEVKSEYASEAIEKWKNENIESLVSEEIKTRFPEKDEKDLALVELQRKIEIMEREKTREKLRNIALKTATTKGLPVDIVDYFIGENEDDTSSNLEVLENVFNNHLEVQVKSRLKDNSYTPPANGSKKTYTVDDLPNMTADEINEFFDSQVK